MLKTRKNILTEDQIKQHENEEKSRVQKEAKIRRNLNIVFGSSEGMEVLRWIMDQSGIFASPVVIDRATWEVKDKAMLYNSGRVSMYLQIRKYLSPSITMPVENQGLRIDESDDYIFS